MAKGSTGRIAPAKMGSQGLCLFGTCGKQAGQRESQGSGGGEGEVGLFYAHARAWRGRALWGSGEPGSRVEGPALERPRHDLLRHLADQDPFLDQEQVDGLHDLLLLGVAVDGGRDAPRALQDLPRLAPRGQPLQGRNGVMVTVVRRRRSTPPGRGRLHSASLMAAASLRCGAGAVFRCAGTLSIGQRFPCSH
jgi:hypothetical protein